MKRTIFAREEVHDNQNIPSLMLLSNQNGPKSTPSDSKKCTTPGSAKLDGGHV